MPESSINRSISVGTRVWVIKVPPGADPMLSGLPGTVEDVCDKGFTPTYLVRFTHDLAEWFAAEELELVN